MRIRHTIISVALLLAAGCDTMERDGDAQMALQINTKPIYMLPNGTGFIDLPSRIVAPGKVRVEITGPTSNGELKDLGKGLLQYTPANGSVNDSFKFTVFSENQLYIDNNKIDIIISSDTTTMPCAVYTRNDSVRNVTGPVTVDVAANDYACSETLTVSVNVPPSHGTASVVGNKIFYTPGPSFNGRDQLLYKATATDPSMLPGYAMLWILGSDSLPGNCKLVAKNDLFFKPLNDSSLLYLNVLANDSICNDSLITITRNPHFGTAFVNNGIRKIGYRNPISSNFDDTLFYKVGSSNIARVIIKRQ